MKLAKLALFQWVSSFITFHHFCPVTERQNIFCHGLPHADIVRLKSFYRSQLNPQTAMSPRLLLANCQTKHQQGPTQLQPENCGTQAQPRDVANATENEPCVVCQSRRGFSIVFWFEYKNMARNVSQRSVGYDNVQTRESSLYSPCSGAVPSSRCS